MSILFKGNLEEGNYTLIKSTDGWVLKGETSYVGFNFADHKDEPTISKMEQVDKDINVRSKDEPQTAVYKCPKCGKDTPIEFDECVWCLSPKDEQSGKE